MYQGEGGGEGEVGHTAGRSTALARQVILDAAHRVLREEGAEALRVRRVADAAGCSTMGVYTHFGGKHGLVAAMWRDGFESLAYALRAARKTSSTPLRELAPSYRRWALRHRPEYLLMFARAVPEFRPDAETQQACVDAFSVLVDAVDAASAVGEVARGAGGRSAEESALVLWGCLHGQVMLELTEVHPASARRSGKRLMDLAVEAVIAGLG